MTKKPSASVFRKLLQRTGGNLSEVARQLGVTRSMITVWKQKDPAFAEAITDERGALLDKCVVSARVLALGVPIYEPVYDDNGKPVYDEENGKPKMQMVGWKERPDSNMLRYLMGTLGRYEGFNEEQPQVNVNINGKGVDVAAWLNKEIEDKAATEETEGIEDIDE